MYVKRGLGSSDLSHLFAQGYVSVESLNAEPDVRMINLRHYRKLIRSMVFQVAFAAVDGP